jgi:hypothetical protein
MYAAKEGRGWQIVKRMDVRFCGGYLAAWRRRAYCGRMVRRLGRLRRGRLLRAWYEVRVSVPHPKVA